MNIAKTFFSLSALGGFLSVAFGAFGAHFLKTRLDDYFLSIFKTGVEYQMYHSLALGLVAFGISRSPSPLLRAAGVAFVIGIVVFSGSLYLLALTKVKMWGAVTPLGGVAFLIGWALLVIHGLRAEF